MPPPQTSTSFEPPVGEPADAAVVAVTATARGVGACANGGELLRAATCYSEAGFREDFADVGQTPESLAALATPAPSRSGSGSRWSTSGA